MACNGNLLARTRAMSAMSLASKRGGGDFQVARGDALAIESITIALEIRCCGHRRMDRIRGNQVVDNGERSVRIVARAEADTAQTINNWRCLPP